MCIGSVEDLSRYLNRTKHAIYTHIRKLKKDKDYTFCRGKSIYIFDDKEQEED